MQKKKMKQNKILNNKNTNFQKKILKYDVRGEEEEVLLLLLAIYTLLYCLVSFHVYSVAAIAVFI